MFTDGSRTLRLQTKGPDRCALLSGSIPRRPRQFELVPRAPKKQRDLPHCDYSRILYAAGSALVEESSGDLRPLSQHPHRSLSIRRSHVSLRGRKICLTTEAMNVICQVIIDKGGREESREDRTIQRKLQGADNAIASSNNIFRCVYLYRSLATGVISVEVVKVKLRRGASGSMSRSRSQADSADSHVTATISPGVVPWTKHATTEQ